MVRAPLTLDAESRPSDIEHMADTPSEPQQHEPSRLAEVARLFLKLGFTAFGGPAAHVALMEEEVVTRRGWLDRQHFLDMVSAVNFVPGPNSTELAIHVGLVRAGFPGLVVAGVCFITPAMLIVLPLAWLYVAHGRTPGVGEALVGIKACMVAIVVVALWRFARTGVKDAFTTVIAIAAAVAGFAWKVPQQELIILGIAAVAGMIWYGRRGRGENVEPRTPNIEHRSEERIEPRRMPAMWLPLGAGFVVSGPFVQMVLFFLKVGATLLGSGYVLASFLHSGLVEQHKWLTERELLDAIAVGQVTPGPLLTAATFIGYVLGARNFGGGVTGGVAGGVLATVAIFLPSFCFIAVLGPVLPRIRRSRWARGALDGMNAAVVSLILVVTVRLGRSAIAGGGGAIDWLSAGVFAASLGLLLGTKLNPTWLIVGSGIVGVLARGVQ